MMRPNRRKFHKVRSIDQVTMEPKAFINFMIFIRPCASHIISLPHLLSDNLFLLVLFLKIHSLFDIQIILGGQEEDQDTGTTEDSLDVKAIGPVFNCSSDYISKDHTQRRAQ
jgi:hypothetical protein